MALPDLADVAPGWAETIVAAVRREYPHAPRHTMTGPDDLLTPRRAHPAFYGCFDWHSAVEMHWALVRLLRKVPSAVDAVAVRDVLDEHLSAEAGAREAQYFRDHPSWERPYGWGWALELAAELAAWDDDPDAASWAAALAPLSDVLTEGFVRWLPTLRHPHRGGMHANTAFALVRALPWARHRAAGGDRRLPEAIGDAAQRLYAADRDYPAGWEPGAADFLSGALTEAVLMAALLPGDEFGPWIARFLPGLAAGQPANLFTPVVVTDPADGQDVHLHGLNLYRAHAFDLLAERMPFPDGAALREARDRHAVASLSAITGSGWMLEHWLAAYAVLLLAG